MQLDCFQFLPFFWKILLMIMFKLLHYNLTIFFLSSPQIKEESVVRLYDVGRLKADEEDFEDMDDDDDNPDGDDDAKFFYFQTFLRLSAIVKTCLYVNTCEISSRIDIEGSLLIGMMMVRNIF